MMLLKLPFKINMCKPKFKSNKPKKKPSKISQILMTIIAVLITFSVGCFLPGLYWWLFHMLNPAGFWQMLVILIISFYAFMLEFVVLFLSTSALLSFLNEVVWS